jgi:hypothetical protein
MSQRHVGLLIGRCALTGLKDQAAAGFLDLNIRAAVRLVGKVALQHPLTSPLLPDQARQRWSDDELAKNGHPACCPSQLV